MLGDRPLDQQRDDASRGNVRRRRTAADRRLRPMREGLEDRLAPTASGWTGGSLAAPALISGPSAAAQDSSQSLPVGAGYAVSEALGRDDARYAASASGEGFAVSNATNNYTARLDASGLYVSSGADAWSLTIQGIGYGGAPQTLGAAASTSTANRVEYDYGGVSQWFVNGPLGLQQGFTLSQRPAGAASGAPLTVDMALGGGLTATADAGGTGVTLVRADGTSAMTYGGLIAYDATGRAIPAYMSVATTADGQSVSIQVDDAGAQYPLTIDPFVQQAKLTGDALDVSLFGYAIAINGDGGTVVIGAKGVDIGFNNGQGVAYVFARSGATWSQAARLTASDGAAGDSLGYAVAISLDGTTVLAGAPGAAIGSNAQQGAVYVYTRSGSTWSQTDKVAASDGATEEYFGSALATNSDGSVFVVGVPNAKVGGAAKRGAAYTFGRSGSDWLQTSKIIAADGAADDLLAFTVAMSADGATVALGSPNAKISDRAKQGAAYLFRNPGTGWAQAAKLVANDGAAGDNFGYSVSISADGSVALAGAPIAKIGSNVEQGAAYIFTQSGSNWPQTIKLVASDGATNDRFGTSVAVSGDGRTAIVGSPFAQVGSNLNQGAAYVFTRPASSWSQSGKLTAADGQAADLFGNPVAVSADGGAVLVGVPSAPVGTHFFQGAAYVYYNSTPVAITAQPANQTVTVGSSVTFAAAASGSPAPTVQWQVSTDGSTWSDINGAVRDWFTYTPVPTHSGSRFRAVFTNNVGSTVATNPATLTIVKKNAVLRISSNVNPRPVGGALNITLTATSADGVGTPNGGGVALNIGGVNRTGTLVNGVATFNNIPVLGIGTYTVTAAYGGDTAFGTATASMTQVVSRATTFLNGVIPTSAVAGQTVTLQGVLTYTGTTGPAVGGVVFMDGGQPIGVGQVATVGGKTVATFTTKTLSVGDHYFQLVYLGEVETAPSSTGVYHMVVSAASSSAAANAAPAPVMAGTAPPSSASAGTGAGAPASSPGGASTFDAGGGSGSGSGVQSFAGSAVTITSNPTNLTAVIGTSVTFTAGAVGSPTLSVQWQVSSDGGNVFTNIAGAIRDWYTFTPALADSGKLYRAVFTNNVGSTVPTSPGALTVVRKSTVLTISSNVNPRQIGGTLNITVRAAAADGVGTPNGGTVSINIGTVNLSGTLVNGTAVFSNIPVLGVGTYTVTAAYGGSGDPKFGPAAASMKQIIDRGTTFLTGQIPTSADFGQSVTMKGVLTYTGTTKPAVGGVMFMDNGQPIGFSQLATASGTTAATFNTSLLGVGDHYIQLVYLGETETAPSATGVYHLVVSAATNSAAAPGGSSLSSSSTATMSVEAASASASTATATATRVGRSAAAAFSARRSTPAASAVRIATPPLASASRVLQQRFSTACKPR